MFTTFTHDDKVLQVGETDRENVAPAGVRPSKIWRENVVFTRVSQLLGRTAGLSIDTKAAKGVANGDVSIDCLNSSVLPKSAERWRRLWQRPVYGRRPSDV